MVNLTDGTLSVSIHAVDQLGNTSSSSTSVFSLNTTLPITQVSVSGAKVGNYIAATGFGIQLSPPIGGAWRGWAVYSIQHSNGSSVASGNITSIENLSFCSNCSLSQILEEGRVFLNITSSDVFGQVQHQALYYDVDGKVDTVPSLLVIGTQFNHTTGVVLGSAAKIRWFNLVR